MPTAPPRPRQSAQNPKVLVAIGLGYGYGRDIVAGIVSYAREHGPWEFVGQVGPMVDEHAIDEAPHYDGVIFHRLQWGAADAALRRGAPAVSVGGDAQSPDVPHVTADSDAVAAMAYTYYRNLGFTSFATYGGFHSIRDQRIGAFARRAHADGYSCVDLGSGSRNKWTYKRKTNRWTREIARLKRGLSKMSGRVAVFAWSSEEARPVIAACDELGIEVPDRIAVLGVDDDAAICELASPPISAIDHGCETIGWEAAKALDLLMQGKPLPSNLIYVDPVRVVVRQSTHTLAVDDEVVVEAVNFIHRNFAEAITVSDVLDKVGVSRPTLEQRFRRSLGRTAHQQITLERIEHAKELLHSTGLELNAISVRCGFSYPSKFSAIFRRETGMSPTAFREQRKIRRRI